MENIKRGKLLDQKFLWRSALKAVEQQELKTTYFMNKVDWNSLGNDFLNTVGNFYRMPEEKINKLKIEIAKEFDHGQDLISQIYPGM